MKKLFVNPEIETVMFEDNDIIRTSFSTRPAPIFPKKDSGTSLDDQNGW